MDVRWNFEEFEEYVDKLGHPLGGAGLMESMRVKMKDILKAVMGAMKALQHACQHAKTNGENSFHDWRAG